MVNQQEQLLIARNAELEKELVEKNRELEIQRSLQKMTEITMAMQRSEEITDASLVLLRQMQNLGITSPVCFVGIMNETDGSMEVSLANTQTQANATVRAIIDDHPVNRKMYEGWKTKNKSHVIDLGGEELTDYRRYLQHLGIKLVTGNNADRRIYSMANFSKGVMGVVSDDLLPGETMHLLQRFAIAFDGTYTRFLDLKKAEEQAREAKIEAALEKVRSRSLAMYKSEEILEVVKAVFEKLSELSIELNTAFIIVFKKGSRDTEWWLINKDQGEYSRILVKYTDIQILKNIFEVKEQGKELFSATYYGEEKNELFRYLFTQTDFKYAPPERQKFIFDSEAISISMGITNKTAIQITRHNEKPFPEEDNEIVKRFAKVFEQTYTRFLDLQKAEAQAREAQIELGLERVRSRAMAMHNSNELSELVAILFEELVKLDLILDRCIIWIFDKETLAARMWMANSEDKRNAESYYIKCLDHPYYEAIITGWKERKPKWMYVLGGNFKKSLDELLLSETELINLSAAVKAGIRSSEHSVISGSFNNFGFIEASGPVAHSEEQLDILSRFGKVFDLSYTRFSDLQKAEAQAREAQIEAALERVRSRSMGMQKSEDLKEVIQVVYEQLVHLNIQVEHTGFIMDYKERDDMHIWLADKHSIPFQVTIPYFDCAHWNSFNEAKEKGMDFFTNQLSFEEKNRFYHDLFKLIPGVPEETLEYYFNCQGLAISTVLLENVSLYIENFSGIAYSDEENTTLMRFGKVFQQTYTRFLDLQRAEEQAREATIEAALEKVRGRAMAMHNSNDLSATASTVFRELRKLGISPIRCGVGLLNKESRKAQLYSATSSAGGDSLSLVGWVMLAKHPVAEKIYNTWLMNEDYYPELSGEQLKSYYENLLSGLSLPSVPDWQNGQKQYGHFLPFSIGCLYAWSEIPYNEAEIKILKRFGTIIDLTFRRYIELKKSEANAREAVRSASLDRVRAETASMRTTRDLEIITPLIWNELNTLGVPFIRCGVFIMDEQQELIHTHLSTPDGKAIAAFHLPYKTRGNMSKVLTHWQQRETYAEHWSETDFTELADTLVTQGSIASPSQYLDTLPHGGFYLHFLPFLQGMLYVGNTSLLSEDDIHLIQSVADAFSTAYARYEDFNKLEAAKKQVDSTLNELQATQKQLIQSEKMASLGELTAGIAHEIQNPLNFVNNFSEVSNELIDEMIEAVAKGNYDEARATAADIKQNLEKINHHGKRADGIVKGMLQHSRSGSVQKEPTNINTLADEYLRLAYHGLRAKDKSFNATLETDYYQSIGDINIIPQDIGRVLLNLYNNAFYAVAERRKQEDPGYKPIVSIATKKRGNQIAISVSDNGNGIPKKIVDKIFQPFFTTKPTGQGTGLGLSLSYDIIKAHGGDIKVETKEGEGTSFIIQLPVS